MSQRTLPGFLVVGGIGFLVDAGVLQALLFAGLGVFSARAVSVLVALTATWFLNRHFVFRTSAHNRKQTEYVRHLVSQSFGALINFGVYGVLLLLVPTLNPLLALAAGSAVALIVNYLMAKYWTFRKERRTTDVEIGQ